MRLILFIKKTIRILVCLCILFSFCSAYAIEEILSYNSDITVNKDGSLLVKEEITVNVEHNRIRRGIYRDFPTRYKDNSGNSYVVDFDVVSVTRNGQSEAYFTEMLSNGVRVNTGGDNFIPQGTQIFTITYKTQYQLGFFDSHDEIYWNVTGNGWGFTINKASATINLPSEAAFTKQTAYTGSYGSGEQNYSFQKLQPNKAYFETTQVLRPGQGFTIALGWPKGIVKQAIRYDKYLMYLLGLILGLIIFIRTVINAKRTCINTIVPLFEPPEGVTPLDLGIILSGNDQGGNLDLEIIIYLTNLKLIKAKLINKNLSLQRVATDEEVHKVLKGESIEKYYLEYFFPNKDSKILLGEQDTRDSGEKIRFAIKILKHIRKAKKKLGLKYDWLLGFCCFLFYIWLTTYWMSFLNVLDRDSYIKIYLISYLIIYFIVKLVFGGLIKVLLGKKFQYSAYKEIPTRTKKLMADFEGLKMYLVATEKQRLSYKCSQELTPDKYEELLPWAMALGVVKIWNKQFEQSWRIRNQNYQPRWIEIESDDNDVDSHNFDITTLQKTIADILNPKPKKQSGLNQVSSSSNGGFSDGDGYSGGGGGGGGGGGR